MISEVGISKGLGLYAGVPLFVSQLRFGEHVHNKYYCFLNALVFLSSMR